MASLPEERTLPRKFTIGYALLPAKQKSFVTPSLQEKSKSYGIEFVPIDPDRALTDQGPFHVILHKLTGSEKWRQKLLAFAELHPEVLIIDHPLAVSRLSNRLTMLQAVADLQVTNSCSFHVSVPKQCVFEDVEDINNVQDHTSELHSKLEVAISASELSFPVIVKPLVVDGSKKSHAMLLAFNSGSLKKIKPPVIIQEFINHGGVIFKVYVAGDHFECDVRASLPDIDASVHQDSTEPKPFCLISNDRCEDLKNAELPPPDFISHLASGLRKALGLNLFNFDLIRDSKSENRYYIIDINYFPGYEKMPGFETTLSKFLATLAEQRNPSPASVTRED